MKERLVLKFKKTVKARKLCLCLLKKELKQVEYIS